MIELEENIKLINNIIEDFKEIKDSLKLDSLKEELKVLEEKSMQDNFWNNPESNQVYSKIKSIKSKINDYESLLGEANNLKDLNELLLVDFDETLKKDLLSSTKNLQRKQDDLKIKVLLSDKYDSNNAILTLHPGAGGTESQDWVQMLYRMYQKWASSNGYSIKELEFLEGDEAGIKSVTFLVIGENAYGYLKGEMGVHRLIRISPFDSGGRRHTSFASVEVLPEITDDVEVSINPQDLRIDTYRASGAGGQHVNKTDSAIRITHLPTNIVVSCQSERSQTMNKETAMKMLKSKLITLKEKENKETIDELKGIQMDIAWGSQIRSYVFCPYTLVKDHRTNYEVGNVESVMNGEITDFMKEYLKMIAKS